MNRKVTIVISILLLVGGVYAFNKISNSKKNNRPPVPETIATVYTETVKNISQPINIHESGRLMAKRRAAIFAEVQGIMEVSDKEFKSGVAYKKGQTMIKIRSNDSYANLLAQKSVLQNLVTSILPDMRLDYPEAYPKWNAYVSDFDINQVVAPLPKVSSDKEKYFITGKNIYTTYYNTKNLEIVQSKFRIRAPFNGILTEATVNPGTVIRQGQKLGDYIDPSVYELEVAISQSMISSLTVGKSVIVKSPTNLDVKWSGKVARINGKIDATTQTVQVFIEVRGKELKEGLYLEAQIAGQEINGVYEVDRKLLIQGKSLFSVLDGKLELLPIDIVHKTKKTVVVAGLLDGTQLVSKIVPGGYQGMNVQIAEIKK
ncbi:MAG: HlyD family efflux transporter periplasmic adaptor subunit [Reichenbachiella sp.]